MGRAAARTKAANSATARRLRREASAPYQSIRDEMNSSASPARIATGPTDPSAQRTDCAEPVDDERHVCDRDHHGVARADLQELLCAERWRAAGLRR